MAANPFLKQLTITTLNTNYSLLTLMQAIDASVTGRCAKLNIQLDPSAGAAHLYIGNEDISGSMYGAVLLAGQVKVWETAGMNIINASQIYLRSDTSGVKVNIDLLVQ